METGDQDGGAGGARLELGRLDALLGFHLRMATAALYREFAQAMEGTALTQKLFAVLELIDANPEVSQVDHLNMARTFIGKHGMDKYNQSFALAGLTNNVMGYSVADCAKHAAAPTSRSNSASCRGSARSWKRRRTTTS